MTLKECTDEILSTVEITPAPDGWSYVVGQGLLRVEGWTRQKDDAEKLIHRYATRIAKVYALSSTQKTQILGA